MIGLQRLDCCSGGVARALHCSAATRAREQRQRSPEEARARRVASGETPRVPGRRWRKATESSR